jgi:hypothetical protein
VARASRRINDLPESFDEFDWKRPTFFVDRAHCDPGRRGKRSKFVAAKNQANVGVANNVTKLLGAEERRQRHDGFARNGAGKLSDCPSLRIPTQAGRGYRFEAGQGSDLMPATIPR